RRGADLAHIPASVRRAVFERDGERCAYRDDRGVRCCETLGLEIHHRQARALGGPATIDNLELRYRPHNTLAAEEDFGREHMDSARGVAVNMRSRVDLFPDHEPAWTSPTGRDSSRVAKQTPICSDGTRARASKRAASKARSPSAPRVSEVAPVAAP